ncbi:MAG: glycosyltransferase family 117 protein, partial [Chloroflexia bacterium]
MRRRTSVPLYGVALLAALAAGALYAAGAAPGLTLRYGGSDGGELAVAVYTLGIPHPTGYPTYVLLAQAVRLFPWGTFAGRLNLFSALAGALTVGLVALVAGELFPEETFSALVAALTAGLSLAVSGLFWSQALIAEVYALHTFF